MFGTYLRLERKRLALDSGTVAEEMGLAETYYRLIEAGRAPLNQGLSFKWLELIARHSVHISGTAAQIHLHRLALYLVGVQIVNADMANMAEYGEVEHCNLRAVEALAERDADFEQFHRKTKNYYTLGDSDEHQRQFLEEIAAPCVGEFLTTAGYANPSGADIVEQIMPTKMLLELPTINIEMISRLVTELTARPFMHTSHLAATWESRMARKFRAAHGIYAHADVLFGDRNVSNFLYPYITETRFRVLRLVFVKAHAGNTSDTLKSDFIARVNHERRTLLELPPLGDEHVKKIDIILLTKAQALKFAAEINDMLVRDHPTDGDDQPYDAYWSFETAIDMDRTGESMHIPIGFVGASGTRATDIWNLDLAESARKNTKFDLFVEAM